MVHDVISACLCRRHLRGWLCQETTHGHKSWHVTAPHCTSQGGMGEVAAAAVEAEHTLRGIGAARALWRRLAAGPPPGGDLFLVASRAEVAAIAAAEPGADAATVRAAFEAGVAAYGAEDWELWAAYVQFAQSAAASQAAAAGRLPSSGDIVRRARKALHDLEAFSAALKELAA